MKKPGEMAKPWVADLSVYEPGRPIEEVAREWGMEPGSILKLASNENSLGPSPRALEAMQAAAVNMHRYPDGGTFYLRRALADKLGVAASQVLPGNGSNEIIQFLVHVFLDPESNIVVSESAFVVYKLIAASFHGQTIATPMKDYTHDLDAMAEAITPDTKIVFVSNPNNPTGTAVSLESFERFMARVPDHVIVAIDEAYVELMPGERRPNSIGYVLEGRNVVVLRTFSKTYGLAGLRLGYAIAPEPIIALLDRVRQPFNVNAMAQAAALGALQDDEHVERTREMVRTGLHQFEAGFRALGLDFVPSVANFMLVEVGKGREIFEMLQKEEGVIGRAMDGYGLPSFIRLTVGTEPENERCLKALKKVLGK